MKKEYNKLSDIQKIKFKEVCGYEYVGDKLKDNFTTDRPFDKEWDLSPWLFTYIFQIDTGCLFCELNHRMTNNSTFGWDYEGNEIDRKIIDKIFPSHY
jgi:hypothetical protein